MVLFENVKMPDGRTTFQHMEELDCRVRFVARGATYEENPTTGKLKEVSPGAFCAEIVDRTTGEIYARGEGADDAMALVSGLLVARTTAKPLTRAQKSDPAFLAQAEQIEELKARIAALEGGKSTKNQ